MKVTIADQKRRIVLPGIQPGDCFAVNEVGPGYLEVVKMEPIQKPASEKVDDVFKKMDKHPLTPQLDWETLKSQTRE